MNSTDDNNETCCCGSFFIAQCAPGHAEAFQLGCCHLAKEPPMNCWMRRLPQPVAVKRVIPSTFCGILVIPIGCGSAPVNPPYYPDPDRAYAVLGTAMKHG